MPEADIRNSLEYYSEMIDDRMEDGLSEEAAVAAIGDLDEIVSQILSETPRPPQTVRPEEKQKSARGNTKVWLIILLVLGSPVWIPLIASAAATVFSVYVGLWSVVISLYAVFFALAIAAIGCVFGSFFMIGSMPKVLVAWGAALVCAGLSVLFLLLSNLVAKGMVALTKWVWSIFRRKEQTV